MMRHRGSVGQEDLPGDAPPIRAELWHPARELHRGVVEICDPALAVCDVDGNRKGFHHLVEDAVALLAALYEGSKGVNAAGNQVAPPLFEPSGPLGGWAA